MSSFFDAVSALQGYQPVADTTQLQAGQGVAFLVSMSCPWTTTIAGTDLSTYLETYANITGSTCAPTLTTDLLGGFTGTLTFDCVATMAASDTAASLRSEITNALSLLFSSLGGGCNGATVSSIYLSVGALNAVAAQTGQGTSPVTGTSLWIGLGVVIALVAIAFLKEDF